MFNTDSVTVTARKAHRCTWCSQPIKPGAIYRRWVTFDDGVFTSKMHPECVDACRAECREFPGEGYLPYENDRPSIPNLGISGPLSVSSESRDCA